MMMMMIIIIIIIIIIFPLEKEMATHSRFLPGKSHGQRSLAGYSPWGLRELNTTQKLNTQFSPQFSEISSIVHSLVIF